MKSFFFTFWRRKKSSFPFIDRRSFKIWRQRPIGGASIRPGCDPTIWLGLRLSAGNCAIGRAGWESITDASERTNQSIARSAHT
jgi:hypothetical protein